MKKWIPTILILVSIASFFVVIDPQYDQVKILKLKKEKNNDYIEKSKILEKRRESLRNEFNSISELNREQLEKMLPDTVDNVRLILDINNIAETYGIKIKEITVQESSSESSSSSSSDSGFSSEPNTNNQDFSNNDSVFDESSITSELIGTIALSFSVSTTYEIFDEFMGDLEDKLRVVDVKSIKITSGEGSFNYGVSLETYWLR
ncbi:MAG: Tfp pilus assembly protein PilO [Candidatus Paceibacteria bacterium]|jgi:Tfp pilus assembly protein PilO